MTTLSIGKAALSNEPTEYYKKEYESIPLEFDSVEALEASIYLSNINDATSAALNIARHKMASGEKLPKEDLQKHFPDIKDRIQTDGSYETYKIINDRVLEQNAYKKIIANSPDTKWNTFGQFVGTLIGGASVLDIGASVGLAAFTASTLPLAAPAAAVLAPFAGAGALASFANFGITNLAENILSEGVTAYSDKLDRTEVSLGERAINVGMGTIAQQGLYLGAKGIQLSKEALNRKVKNRAIKAVMDNHTGKTIQPNEFDEVFDKSEADKLKKFEDSLTPGESTSATDIETGRVVNDPNAENTIKTAEGYESITRNFSYDEDALRAFMEAPDVHTKELKSKTMKELQDELEEVYMSGKMSDEVYEEIKSTIDLQEDLNMIKKGLAKCTGVIK